MSRATERLLRTMVNPRCPYCGRVEVKIENGAHVGCSRDAPAATPPEVRVLLEFSPGMHRLLRTCEGGIKKDGELYGISWDDVKRYEKPT